MTRVDEISTKTWAVSLLGLSLMGCATGSPRAESGLAERIAPRIEGDRTGVCVAAATLEAGEVQKAVVCADSDAARVDTATAFEIGSVTKTMTGALLASLVAEGRLALTDTVQEHLGVEVPSYQGEPIALQHLVTHTSGLPSIPPSLQLAGLEDPYAELTIDQVLAVLPSIELTRAPGTSFEYSNYAVMLLAHVVATSAGQSYEELLEERLLGPIAMRHTYLSAPPEGVRVATGHLPMREPTPAWTIPGNLAGIGGVRSTLDDMVLYAKAQLGYGDPAVVETLQRTHAAVDLGTTRPANQPEMGMGWIRDSLQGSTVLLHEGGTGGFSSLVVIWPEADRGVVLLADTASAQVGTLSELGAYLIGETETLAPARTVEEPSSELLESLAGQYDLEGVPVVLGSRDGQLVATLPEGEELTFGFDSRGDFFPQEVDALLTPHREPGGKQTFTWQVSGVPLHAVRK